MLSTTNPSYYTRLRRRRRRRHQIQSNWKRQKPDSRRKGNKTKITFSPPHSSAHTNTIPTNIHTHTHIYIQSNISNEKKRHRHCAILNSTPCLEHSTPWKGIYTSYTQTHNYRNLFNWFGDFFSFTLLFLVVWKQKAPNQSAFNPSIR